MFEMRLSTMGALGRKQAGGPQVKLPSVLGKRNRAGGLYLSLVMDMLVVKQHAQWWETLSKGT